MIQKIKIIDGGGNTYLQQMLYKYFNSDVREVFEVIDDLEFLEGGKIENIHVLEQECDMIIINLVGSFQVYTANAIKEIRSMTKSKIVFVSSAAGYQETDDMLMEAGADACFECVTCKEDDKHYSRHASLDLIAWIFASFPEKLNYWLKRTRYANI